MKILNVPLEDENYRLLKKAKGKIVWREFLIKIAKGGKQDDTSKM